MLLNADVLAIERRFSSILLAIDYGLYGPGRQYGKGQDIKNCNLAQVEHAVKMDIKIEWNSDDYD